MKNQWLEESRAIEEYENLPWYKKLVTKKPVRTITEDDVDAEGHMIAGGFKSYSGHNKILHVRYSPYGGKHFYVSYEEIDEHFRHYSMEAELINGLWSTYARLNCRKGFANHRSLTQFHELCDDLASNSQTC